MTLPPANETIMPHPEPYGIFGTRCQHKPGDVISDELGNWYKVTETSTYCAEICLYNTPAELVKPANPDARCWCPCPLIPS